MTRKGCRLICTAEVETQSHWSVQHELTWITRNSDESDSGRRDESQKVPRLKIYIDQDLKQPECEKLVGEGAGSPGRESRTVAYEPHRLAPAAVKRTSAPNGPGKDRLTASCRSRSTGLSTLSFSVCLSVSVSIFVFVSISLPLMCYKTY